MSPPCQLMMIFVDVFVGGSVVSIEQVPLQSHEVCSYSLRLAKCIELPVNVKTEAMCFLLMGMSQGSCESTQVIS